MTPRKARPPKGGGSTPGRIFVVGASGASGARLALRFLGHLLDHPGVEAVHFVPSDAFRLVLRREEGLELPAALAALGHRRKLVLHGERDLDAPIASGSFPVHGTVLIPASMATVGAVAAGAGRNLLHRAAEVALKERRPLIVVPRETPLSPIHLRNLATLAEAGARVAPFIPAFYGGPRSIEDLLDAFCQRLLDHLGLAATLSPRWGEGTAR
ncbi:MAG: UbiX family flavin prenyltransferase [Acidobacteriota bacterium]